jgi:hypothetical protein
MTKSMTIAKKAKERIGVKMVSSGTIDVVLEHRSTLESLASLINLANGLTVVLGTAFLAGKIGKGVAAKSSRAGLEALFLNITCNRMRYTIYVSKNIHGNLISLSSRASYLFCFGLI